MYFDLFQLVTMAIQARQAYQQAVSLDATQHGCLANLAQLEVASFQSSPSCVAIPFPVVLKHVETAHSLQQPTTFEHRHYGSESLLSYMRTQTIPPAIYRSPHQSSSVSSSFCKDELHPNCHTHLCSLSHCEGACWQCLHRQGCVVSVFVWVSFPLSPSLYKLLHDCALRRRF